MKKLLLAASAAVTAFAVAPAAQAAPTFTVTLNSDSVAVPVGTWNTGNDFSTELAGFGVTGEAFGASVVADEVGLVLVEYIASESFYSDSFSYGGGYIQETNTTKEGVLTSADADYQSFYTFVPASTLLDFIFGSSGGGTADTSSASFAVYVPTAGMTSGSTYTSNVLYFGYDDNGAGPDDNHDDMIIRVTILPVPEPATWALMIAGVAAVGLSMRRRSASTRVAFS